MSFRNSDLEAEKKVSIFLSELFILSRANESYSQIVDWLGAACIYWIVNRIELNAWLRHTNNELTAYFFNNIYTIFNGQMTMTKTHYRQITYYNSHAKRKKKHFPLLFGFWYFIWSENAILRQQRFFFVENNLVSSLELLSDCNNEGKIACSIQNFFFLRAAKRTGIYFCRKM